MTNVQLHALTLFLTASKGLTIQGFTAPVTTNLDGTEYSLIRSGDSFSVQIHHLKHAQDSWQSTNLQLNRKKTELEGLIEMSTQLKSQYLAGENEHMASGVQHNLDKLGEELKEVDEALELLCDEPEAKIELVKFGSDPLAYVNKIIEAAKKDALKKAEEEAKKAAKPSNSK